jgi:hypothetical protein
MTDTTTDLHGSILAAILDSAQDDTAVVVRDIVNSLQETGHIPAPQARRASEVVAAAIGLAVDVELSTRGVVGLLEARTIADQATQALRTASICAEEGSR